MKKIIIFILILLLIGGVTGLYFYKYKNKNVKKTSTRTSGSVIVPTDNFVFLINIIPKYHDLIVNTIEPNWKKLSIEMKDKNIIFKTELPSDNKLKIYGVEETPSVIYMKGKEVKAEYEGDWSYESLRKFVLDNI